MSSAPQDGRPSIAPDAGQQYSYVLPTSGYPTQYAGDAATYYTTAAPASFQSYARPIQTVQYQQPALMQYAQTVQYPQQAAMTLETREVKQTRPKVTYTSKYVTVNQTITVPQTVKQPQLVTVQKQVFDTKWVPVQVPKMVAVQEEYLEDRVITVPKVIQEEREIRIPVPLKEKRTIRVPRQRIVTEEEEHTITVPAVEEYTQTVTVPRVYEGTQQYTTYAPTTSYATQTYVAAPATTQYVQSSYAAIPATQYVATGDGQYSPGGTQIKTQLTQP